MIYYQMQTHYCSIFVFTKLISNQASQLINSLMTYLTPLSYYQLYYSIQMFGLRVRMYLTYSTITEYLVSFCQRSLDLNLILMAIWIFNPSVNKRISSILHLHKLFKINLNQNIVLNPFIYLLTDYTLYEMLYLYYLKMTGQHLLISTSQYHVQSISSITINKPQLNF